MYTSAMNTKVAPLPPSSMLLDKRWKDEALLRHQYRLKAMRGEPMSKEIINRVNLDGYSPPQKRKAKSAKPISREHSSVSRKRRPYTSKEATTTARKAKGATDLDEKEFVVPVVNVRINERPLYRPVTSKPVTSRTSNTLPSAIKKNNIPNGERTINFADDVLTEKDRVSLKNMPDTPTIPKELKRRPVTSKNRPTTSKATGKWRPLTSRERNLRREERIPPIMPQRQRWVKSGVRPIKSEYSRDAMNDFFKKQQYYKLSILQRQRIFSSRRKIPTKSDDERDDYQRIYNDDQSLSGTSSSMSLSASPSPSPTPTPPPVDEREEINLEEITKTLFLDGKDMAMESGDDNENETNGKLSLVAESAELNRELSNAGSLVGSTNDENETSGSKENVLAEHANTESPNSRAGAQQGNDTGSQQGKDDNNGSQQGKDDNAGNQNNIDNKNSNNSIKDNTTNSSANSKNTKQIYNKEESRYIIRETNNGNNAVSSLYPKSKHLENFVPPSHIIKLAEDTLMTDSDFSSDEEPMYYLYDKKPGKFVYIDDKYVPVNHVKGRKKIKKEVKQVRIQSALGGAEGGSIERPSIVHERKIARISVPSLSNAAVSDYDENIEKREGLTDYEYDDDERADNENLEKEQTAQENENEHDREDIVNELDVKYASGDQAYANENDADDEFEEEDIHFKVDDDDNHSIDESRDLMKENNDEDDNDLRNDTPAIKDFDAMKVKDSVYDQYGRRKDRARPSSSLYDILPPLNPDPVKDKGDINRCKIRLLGETVTIREGIESGTKESLEKILGIIISNNNDNRRWLRKIYRDEYLQSLLLDLRKILPADVASVISYMMIPICEFDAMSLWDALKGLHRDPEVLCEILCTRDNRELALIREAYNLRYKQNLLDDIEDETQGSFQRILLELGAGKRDDNPFYTKEDAATEARQIHALLEGNTYHLDNKLIEIFSQRSIDGLRKIVSEYRKFKGYGLDVDLVKILQKDFCRCIITIMLYIQNPPNYFVEKLHHTHYRGSDDDKSLCRILISRSERDIEMITGLFELRYDMPLLEFIGAICHGSLKGLAMRLINDKSLTKHNVRIPDILPLEEDLSALKLLTLPEAIKIILRKSKVMSKCSKILHTRKERQRQAEAESSDTAEEFDLDEEGDNDDDGESKQDYNSEEEEERAAKEAQKELMNGLKNISFADNVDVAEIDPAQRSVFADVSFAAASRGILKKGEPNEDEDDDEDVSDREPDLDGELGDQKVGGPKMTQLNGPVLDPTFVGREDKKGSKRTGKSRKFRGTVKGVGMDEFNALKDAQAIGKAMLQKNRNVEGILQFLTTRNNAQRQLIIREFFRRYRRDLVDDLRVLAPQHEEVTLSLLLSVQIYASASLYAGISSNSKETAKQVFIEILCCSQNDEIAIIKRAFNGIFGMDIIDEISKFANGHFYTFLAMIAECKRDEGDFIDDNIVRKDAQALFEATKKKPTNHDVFIEIFATKSFPHINAVLDHYLQIARIDLLEILDQVLQGDFLEGITAVICNVRDAPMFFCERIYRSMAYKPVYNTLIRCIITRAEIDLQTVKAAFRRTYGRTIYSMIDRDMDFLSKKILLNVVKK